MSDSASPPKSKKALPVVARNRKKPATTSAPAATSAVPTTTSTITDDAAPQNKPSSTSPPPAPTNDNEKTSDAAAPNKNPVGDEQDDAPKNAPPTAPVAASTAAASTNQTTAAVSSPKTMPPASVAVAAADSAATAKKKKKTRKKTAKKSAQVPQKQYPRQAHELNISSQSDFADWLYLLLLYRAQHENCEVPYNHGELGKWVEHVRASYRQYRVLKQPEELSRCLYLTEDRIKVLNSIGFIWSSAVNGPHNKKTLQQETYDKKWEASYAELVKYKAEHGHCNVPQAKSGLGKFVKVQRLQYTRRQQQLKTAAPLRNVLPTHRMKKLEEIGFQWTVKPGMSITWEERFEELLRFKERFGHTNVTQGWKENVPLGRWVMKQRVYYNHRMRGDKLAHLMPDDRMQKLNDIGFLWVGVNYSGSSKKDKKTESKKRKEPSIGVDLDDAVEPSSPKRQNDGAGGEYYPTANEF